MFLHFFPIVSSFFSDLQERRIAQQREVLRKDREIAQKMAARAYTKEYMSGLLATVFTSLRADGYFFDPIERGQLPFSQQKRCHSCIWIRTCALLISRHREQLLAMADVRGCQTFGEEKRCKRTLGQ